jgi:hypothetical protein
MSKPSSTTTPTAATVAVKKTSRVILDVKTPVEKTLIVMPHVEDYFKRSLKVKEMGSVKGKLGDSLSVKAEGDKLLFTMQGEAIPKRQIKYLARRYLNKEKLHNYLRVVADGKDSYKIKFWTREAEGGE